MPGMNRCAVKWRTRFAPSAIPIAALSVAAITSRLQGQRRRTVIAQLQNEVRRIEASLEPVLESAHLDLVMQS